MGRPKKSKEGAEEVALPEPIWLPTSPAPEAPAAPAIDNEGDEKVMRELEVDPMSEGLEEEEPSDRLSDLLHPVIATEELDEMTRQRRNDAFQNDVFLYLKGEGGRELGDIAEKKKYYRRGYHHNGLFLDGTPFHVFIQDIDDVKKIVKRVDKDKRKIPLPLLFAGGFFLILVALFVVMITIKIINTIGADLSHKSQQTTQTATFVPVSTGAVVQQPAAVVSSSESEEEKSALEIERKRLDKDKTIVQIDQEVLQKKFDNLKEDYDTAQEKLSTCESESDRQQIILMKVRQFCAKVETDESAELCTLLFK